MQCHGKSTEERFARELQRSLSAEMKNAKLATIDSERRKQERPWRAGPLLLLKLLSSDNAGPTACAGCADGLNIQAKTRCVVDECRPDCRAPLSRQRGEPGAGENSEAWVEVDGFVIDVIHDAHERLLLFHSLVAGIGDPIGRSDDRV